MNFINTTQSYVRPAAKAGIIQQLRAFNSFEFPGDRVLWRRAGKVGLLMLPVVLMINLIIASAITNIERDMAAADDHRHALMDKNIEMLAKKARFWSPEHVRDLAADKLSLYTGSEKQVGKFNRRKGTFIYL
ncbi:MAG: hypothetical protein ACWGOX_12840 [Desulforhopalus sp.]